MAQKHPKCKICGAQHGFAEPHQWSGPTEHHEVVYAGDKPQVGFNRRNPVEAQVGQKPAPVAGKLSGPDPRDAQISELKIRVRDLTIDVERLVIELEATKPAVERDKQRRDADAARAKKAREKKATA